MSSFLPKPGEEESIISSLKNASCNPVIVKTRRKPILVAISLYD